MLMSNLILIDIHFVEAERHMLICFFISMLVDEEEKWNNYKMKVFIKKGVT